MSAGFAAASSLSVKQIRESVISPAELERSVLRSFSNVRYGTESLLSFLPFLLATRVGKIEMIDEVEELNLVLAHYAVTWGSFGGESIGLTKR